MMPPVQSPPVSKAGGDCGVESTKNKQKNMKTTQEIYEEIMASEVFRMDGESIDLPEKLIELASAIKSEDETDWNMGEFTEAPLSELIVGAYWALTEWHAGQWSESYAALCALGGIFSPGMTNAPDEDEPCFTAYELVNAWFSQNSKARKEIAA